MNNIKLNATKSIQRVLHVLSFNTDSTSPNEWENIELTSESKPAIHNKMLAMLENGFKDTENKRVIYAYFVSEEEILIDDRNQFGHDVQKSTRELSNFIPMTYVRGEKTTINDLILQSFKNELPKSVNDALVFTLKDELGIPLEGLRVHHLGEPIIMIPGEGKKETFFDVCKEKVQFRPILSKQVRK